MNPTKLLPETREIVEKLRELSGYPVSYFEDGSLRTNAALQIGTPANPVHLIRYQPGRGSPDYWIAFEAGNAIRLFRHQAERRFRLSGSAAHRDQVARDIASSQPDLPAEQQRGLAQFLFDSLMLQVRSMPIGILVDQWIYHRYPALRSLQAEALRAQLPINETALAPEHAKRFPALMLKANRAMNSAFAIAASELLREPHLAVPYRAAGLEQIGLDLLADLPDPDAEVLDDRALITVWAERLGITPWLVWLPFE